MGVVFIPFIISLVKYIRKREFSDDDENRNRADALEIEEKSPTIVKHPGLKYQPSSSIKVIINNTEKTVWEINPAEAENVRLI